jgi:serine/threonine-protein kinase HipA
VQWYFDNLLPEENLREAISKEADIRGDDAFALLEYLGAESAGSLVLLPPDRTETGRGGLQALSDNQLCERIRNLSRATLSSGAPKRMSAAGAQNKLLVVYKDNELYEPVGSEPSLPILDCGSQLVFVDIPRSRCTSSNALTDMSTTRVKHNAVTLSMPASC